MSFKKVSLYSVPALRTEADEHLSEVFDSFGYTESFKLIDTKLALGYLSVALAALMYYIEKQYKNDFTNKKYVSYLQILVAGFFIIQSIIFLFGKFVEKNIKYTGAKKGKAITVSTFIKTKTDPIYRITIKSDNISNEFSIPFKDIFFDDGFLSMDAFKTKIGEFFENIDKSK
jgi:hypothetical protein